MKNRLFRAVACSCLVLGLNACMTASQSVGPSAPMHDAEAAPRVIRAGEEQTAPFWPGGVIPYFYSPAPNQTILSQIHLQQLKDRVRQSMDIWEKGVGGGLIKFQEISYPPNVQSLEIDWYDARDLVIPTGFSTMIMVTGGYNNNIDNLLLVPNAINPTTPFYAGSRSALANISYLLGHALGLQDELRHPNMRSLTHAVPDPGATGCPVDPYAMMDSRSVPSQGREVDFDFDSPSTIVADNGGNPLPDFNSIMLKGSRLCTTGRIRFYKNSDNTPVNGKAGDTGAISEGDFATVRAIYGKKTTLGNYWNPASSIKFEYVVAGSPKTALETSVGNNIRQALYRWLVNLDPSIGAISKAPAGSWVAPGDPVFGPTIRVGIDLTQHTQDFSISCNPSNPTNYCLIKLYDATDAAGNHLLANNFYVNNMLQAAFGVALGLSASDPNSATYIYNIWNYQFMFPTTKDIDALRQIYHSPKGNWAPLIRVQYGTGSSTKYQYATTWEQALKLGMIDFYRPRNDITAYFILGRTPLFGGAIAGVGPSSGVSQMVWRNGGNSPVLFGKTPIGTLISNTPGAVCPQAAMNAITSSSSTGNIVSSALFNAAQTATPTTLTAYWDNISNWVMAPGRVLGASCQVTVGYIAN